MQGNPQSIPETEHEYPAGIRRLLVAGLLILAAASATAAFFNRDHVQWWKIALYGILLGAYLVAEKKAYSMPQTAGQRAHEPLRYLLSIAWWALIVGSVGVYAVWPFTQTAVTGIGVILMIAGSALRIWSVSTLGPYFSGHIETWAGQTVLQAGPYRVIRHPGYAGNILQAVGLPLVVNAYGALPWTVVVVGLFVGRMLWEEDWLTKNLQGYREYRKVTKRLLPGIW
jgi:protein-S-isoprenylcysteine O-methyltransferase Ste14